MALIERLKAQPALMEALGVGAERDGRLFLDYEIDDWGGQRGHLLELDNDNCPGSALTVIRCMEWMAGYHQAPRLVNYDSPNPLWEARWDDDGNPQSVIATTMVQACLEACLAQVEPRPEGIKESGE